MSWSRGEGSCAQVKAAENYRDKSDASDDVKAQAKYAQGEHCFDAMHAVVHDAHATTEFGPFCHQAVVCSIIIQQEVLQI